MNDIIFNNVIIGFFLGVIILFLLMVGWWLEMLIESYQGFQNKQIRNNIKLGFKLFLVSEFMLFCSTFWAYLHSALTPTVWIGCVWPPVALTIFNPWRLPLIMTLALIGSGLSLTLAYIVLLRDESVKECLIVLLYAISHGCLFIFFQVFEFFKRPVNFTDSVFGCSFYASTGLHAFHVLVGLIFLLIIALFVYLRIYTTSRHLSFDLGIWYWHFVDVMWLVVFALCYVWCMGWFFSLEKMFLIRPYYLLINSILHYTYFIFLYKEVTIILVALSLYFISLLNLN